MYIPKNAKKALSRTFYDKVFYVVHPEKTVDDEGGGKLVDGGNEQEFYGNVNYATFTQVARDFGLDYDVDLVITMPAKEPGERWKIEVGDIVHYNFDKYGAINGRYLITELKEFDSHTLILCVATETTEMG